MAVKDGETNDASLFYTIFLLTKVNKESLHNIRGMFQFMGIVPFIFKWLNEPTSCIKEIKLWHMCSEDSFIQITLLNKGSVSALVSFKKRSVINNVSPRNAKGPIVPQCSVIAIQALFDYNAVDK